MNPSSLIICMMSVAAMASVFREITEWDSKEKIVAIVCFAFAAMMLAVFFQWE